MIIIDWTSKRLSVKKSVEVNSTSEGVSYFSRHLSIFKSKESDSIDNDREKEDDNLNKCHPISKIRPKIQNTTISSKYTENTLSMSLTQQQNNKWMLIFSNNFLQKPK